MDKTTLKKYPITLIAKNVFMIRKEFIINSFSILTPWPNTDGTQYCLIHRRGLNTVIHRRGPTAVIFSTHNSSHFSLIKNISCRLKFTIALLDKTWLYFPYIWLNSLAKVISKKIFIIIIIFYFQNYVYQIWCFDVINLIKAKLNAETSWK